MRKRSMIKNQWLVLFTLTILAAACGDRSDSGKKQMPDMTENYLLTSKGPMGLFTAKQIIDIACPDVDVAKNSKPFDEFFKKFNKEHYSKDKNIYAVVASGFYPNDEDVDAMVDFVLEGNTLLVAADHFDGGFLDKFHLSYEYVQPVETMLTGNFMVGNTGTQMADSSSFTKELYSFFYYSFNRQISRDSSFPSQVLAKTDKGYPTALALKYGSGKLIVATNAHSFTNYFLLTKNNYRYLTGLLAYLPVNATDITWDTYYNKLPYKRDKNFSSFQELMKHPALKWAFWLTLLGALLVIIMGLVGVQRVIAIIKPNTNSSVEFGETVARLYLLKKDNKNIAIKMITYFLEQVRSKYYISTATLNQEFADMLAAKSGVGSDKVHLLLRTIDQLQNETMVSDYMLLDLNGQLNQFAV
ncbi:MAG: DUF4350 domain-containing protein [Chitinophagaceae bacterium]